MKCLSDIYAFTIFVVADCHGFGITIVQHRKPVIYLTVYSVI